MAKGESFLIKCFWENYTFLIPGVCNTDLISARFVSAQNLELNDLFKKLDSDLGTTAWQIAVFPVYQSDDYSFSKIRKVFPGLTRVLTKPSGDTVKGPDEKPIPGAVFVFNENIGSGGTGYEFQLQLSNYPDFSNTSGVFPFIRCKSWKGIRPTFEYDIINVPFIIAKDDFITDGKINSDLMSSGDMYLRRIEVFAKDNDLWSVSWGGYGPSGNNARDYWSGKKPIFPSEISDDPYTPGGETPQTPGGTGGTGDFDGSSTDIGIPDAPSISAASTGFISLFNPSLSQLNDLASFMWSDLFDIDTFKKLFADPMQTILGLSVVPGPIPSAGASEVKVGNISTGVTMNKAAQQYITIDCGSLNVNEYWGAYLDYDPYTKCEIYLPYIGTHAIAADDIMGKTVQVVYRIDILSGACMAYIKCGGSVLYQFAGQCAASIPITGNDWTNVINGTLSVAASIGSMVATGGATAPLAASALANTAVNQMKPSVEKSGSLSGAAGIMGIQQPYLIVTRPRQALPHRQNTYTGYPSLYSVNLSELTGYTEIEKIHLEGIPATEKELTEIDTLLKGGVIF